MEWLQSIDWKATASAFVSLVDFLGDLLTVIVSAAAIFGLIKYRKKLSATFRILRLEHMTDRRQEIAKTLELLEGSIVKGRSLDARALFGRLNGQLIALAEMFPEFKQLQLEVASIAHDNGPLTEAIKQRLMHQISAQFDAYKLKNMNEIAGEGR